MLQALFFALNNLGRYRTLKERDRGRDFAGAGCFLQAPILGSWKTERRIRLLCDKTLRQDSWWWVFFLKWNLNFSLTCGECRLWIFR